MYGVIWGKVLGLSRTHSASSLTTPENNAMWMVVVTWEMPWGQAVIHPLAVQGLGVFCPVCSSLCLGLDYVRDRVSTYGT